MERPFAKQLYSVWIKNFQDTDSFDRSTVRLIISFTIIGTLVSLAYFFIHPFVPFNVPRYVFLLLPILLNLFCLLLLTKIHHYLIASGIIFSFWTCFVVGSYYSGGVKSLVIPWLSLMPVLANLMIDYRRSIIWFAISLITVVVFILIDSTLPPVKFSDAYWRNLLSVTGLCLILFLFTSLFDKARYKILQILKVRNEDLARQKEEIKTINFQLQQKIVEIERKNATLEKHWNTLIDISKDKSINFGTLEEALNHISNVTARSLGVSRVSVWLYQYVDEEITTEKIECIAAYSLIEDKYFKQEFLTRDDNGRYFEAIKKERVIAADDALNHPDTSAFSEKYLKAHNITSMMDAPFFMDGKLAGVLCSEHQHEFRKWSHEDIIFATSMADIVSLAFRSAARRTYEKQLRELSREIQQQNELLKKKSEEVERINESLEQRVQKRTEELVEKNRQLAEYAFINSHLLRGPLCRILGLVNLFNYTSTRAEEELIERLRLSSQELDDVVNKINKVIADERIHPDDSNHV